MGYLFAVHPWRRSWIYVFDCILLAWSSMTWIGTHGCHTIQSNHMLLYRILINCIFGESWRRDYKRTYWSVCIVTVYVVKLATCSTMCVAHDPPPGLVLTHINSHARQIALSLSTAEPFVKWCRCLRDQCFLTHAKGKDRRAFRRVMPMLKEPL